MNRVRRQIGWSRELCESMGGPSVHIVLLDTGISFHPDIEDNIVGFVDFQHHRNAVYDDNGHGTHVAGCIAGSGYASGGKYCGLAPKSRLTALKILDEKGDGDLEHLLAALYWVLEHRVEEQIRIMNISVGINEDGSGSGYGHEGDGEYSGYRGYGRGIEEIRVLMDTLWDQGVLIICAAGNAGPENGTISALGLGSKVIAVGCHDGGAFGNRRNLCEHYSGRGSDFSREIKPDLVAPGTNIISCNNEYIRVGNKVKNGYVGKSGTSMSTPVVTGAAALLLQKYPYLSNDQVKHRLFKSTRTVSNDILLQGRGMIDLRKLLME